MSAFQSLAKEKDWQVVVVGDVNTYVSWELEGTHFLEREKQRLLGEYA